MGFFLIKVFLMIDLSIASIFRQQQLLVDQDFELPRVEKFQNDLSLYSDSEVIARDLDENEPIPQGYQLVPKKIVNIVIK